MAKETTYEEIARELKNRIYKPVYYLMGEESYYIDRISEYIAQTVLNENEKEFNQTIVYGADTDIATVINAAKRYPMMSKYQVVIVKEAQNIKNIEELVYYLQKPLDSTILVLCHKHGTLDRRKKLAAEIEKVGVLFESKKIKDAQLPGFISSYLKRRSVEIEPKASEMMAEFVGADLSRMAGELEKLIITLPRGQKRITPEQIERNIGISKDYNNFELRNALVAKDVFKANQIIKYFVLTYLQPVGSVTAIDGLLDFTYVENRGVAFGMFSDMRWFFVAVTAVLIAIIIYIMFKKKPSGKMFYISAALIIGGGIGNLIDRIFYGFVVDYISVSFFPPVCNFADYCITVGTILLIVYVLFFSNVMKSEKKVNKSNE